MALRCVSYKNTCYADWVVKAINATPNQPTDWVVWAINAMLFFSPHPVCAAVSKTKGYPMCSIYTVGYAWVDTDFRQYTRGRK